MKVPDRYLDLSLFVHPLNLEDMDKPEAWPEADVYPPTGFLPTLSLFDVGNGDVSGFYWPIGKEADEPLLCDTHHDEWALVPQASDLEGLGDFNIYDAAIAEYLRQGKDILAVRLRVLVGELMWSETISFREHYDYSMGKHRDLLRSEIEQAGLTARLTAVAKS